MIFLNSASSAAALVVYLPGVCTHTDTEKGQSPGYFKIFGEKKIYLMNTLYFLKAVSVADRPQIADP